MFCSKCGAQIPENGVFCSVCGSQTEIENSQAQTSPKTKKARYIIPIIIAVSSLIVVAGIAILVNITAKANLQKELMRDWENVEVENGSYYSLELDFSEDTIEYNFDSFYIDETIATHHYTIISGNQFKIDGRNTVYTVEFNDDKTMMTISPALTSASEYEYWFNLED